MISILIVVFVSSPVLTSSITHTSSLDFSENHWRCADGSRISTAEKCDGVRHCPDGSDEELAVCRISKRQTSGKCRLPPYPDHGSYVVVGQPNARPGEAFATVFLTVTCDAGYIVNGNNGTYCIEGFWPVEMSQCVRYCRLDPHPSVEYICQVQGSNNETRPCNQMEPSGAIVQPRCRTPNYYSSQPLGSMRCQESSWDYVATCTPDCGREALTDSPIVLGRRQAHKGELPWHVGIYRKNVQPYTQVCGGSIISTSAVVSAAHCFWSPDKERLLPASIFAVAAGKLYRTWDDPNDVDAQKSDVSEIKIPVRFLGIQTNFQDDISLVILSTPLEFRPYVRPVCIDFDVQFNRRQLVPGNVGKMGGWGLTGDNGVTSQILKVVDLPYVNINKCINATSPGYRQRITSDKICAGYNSGAGICRGDSGGGLSFPETKAGSKRYYLRGVVSVPLSNDACNAFALIGFTQILAHEYFIENYNNTDIEVHPWRPQQTEKCKLPPYPNHGTYAVANQPNAKPGEAFQTVYMTVTCDLGYGVNGKNYTYCVEGFWTEQMPKCVRYCRLNDHPSVEYLCQVPRSNGESRPCTQFEPSGTIVEPRCKTPNYYSYQGLSLMRCIEGSWDYVATCQPRGSKNDQCRLNPHPSVEYLCQIPDSNGGTRSCKQYEPSGTIVEPRCRTPNYHSYQILPSMRCLGGIWDYVATCLPDCGTETPRGDALIIDGRRAERGEFPWHVGVYRRNVQPYLQICGGSIISTSIIISAAHCFWSDLRKFLPASLFAVAAGKLYRPWDEPQDVDVQKSDVADIKIPARFLGEQTNFQDDIALVFLSTPFEYRPYVRPVCIDFDIRFDRRQLVPGNIGRVAGWGLTGENAGASPILKVVDLPYVDINKCLDDAPLGFRHYITGDKICAGFNNGTALCRGDSGGGLCFPETERDSKRYYLRGIVSVAPKNENACNAYTVTSFTQILAHERFIKEHFSGA